MSIAAVGGLGTIGSVVSGTTLVLTTNAQLDAGNVGILTVVMDNVGTTDADHSEVSGVTDSAGNTYTKLHEHTNGQGGAAAGVTVSLWMTRATTNLASGGTVTITFANTIVAKTASFYEFTVGAPLTIAGSNQNVLDGGNGWGSLAISGLASAEYLFFRGLGKEGASNTGITPTTNYTGISGVRSDANSTSSVMCRGEFRIVTATGETSNPSLTVSADSVSAFVALVESAAGNPRGGDFLQLF